MIALAFGLFAEVATPRPRVTLEPATAHCFAVLAVENRFGMYNATETLQTPHGPVSVRYTTTPSITVGDPDSADTAEVVALPDGVVADPDRIEIMETDTGRICLVRYLGG
jgi:hypothetical protein